MTSAATGRRWPTSPNLVGLSSHYQDAFGARAAMVWAPFIFVSSLNRTLRPQGVCCDPAGVLSISPQRATCAARLTSSRARGYLCFRCVTMVVTPELGAFGGRDILSAESGLSRHFFLETVFPVSYTNGEGLRVEAPYGGNGGAHCCGAEASVWTPLRANPLVYGAMVSEKPV